MKLGNNWPYLTAMIAAVAFHGAAAGEPAPLVGREFFFGLPDRTMPRLSLDEQKLAYIAPHKGTLNLWVRTVGQADDRPCTEDADHSIRWIGWTNNGKYLVFSRDFDEAGNFHVFKMPAEGGEPADLTPFAKSDSEVVEVIYGQPNLVALESNNFNLKQYNLLRADAASGFVDWVCENSIGLFEWTFNQQGELQWASRFTEGGGKEVMSRLSPTDPWRSFIRWQPAEAMTSRLVSFAAGGEGFYVLSSSGSPTATLREVSWTTAEQRWITREDSADVVDVLIHPSKRHAQAVAYDKDRLTWQLLDDSLKEDFDRLAQVAEGEFRIVDRGFVDKNWIVEFRVTDGPPRYYLYNRAAGKADLLFTEHKIPDDFKPAPTKRIEFAAKDGLKIPGYLTTPADVPATKLPMVVYVPDGLWQRTDDLYDPVVQWLANRGYAVIKIEPRGTVGHGKKFVEAGVKEWGGAMLRDLLDGVAWAVDQGVADPARVAIVGQGIGGYAALAAMAAEPAVFCCGADLGGPSDLITFLQSDLPKMRHYQPLLHARIGDPVKDVGMLKERSPINSVERYTKPLFIAHWVGDKRVNVTESQRMAKALEDAGKTVKYHEFEARRPDPKNENVLRMYAELEAFLSEHAGGRSQPQPQPAE